MIEQFRTEVVKVISELALENLGSAYRTDVLLLLVDSVHRIIDYAKTSDVLKRVGSENVVNVMDKFNELVDSLILGLGANDFVPRWVHESSLENLRDGFLIRNYRIRGHLNQVTFSANFNKLNFNFRMKRWHFTLFIYLRVIYSGTNIIF